MCKQQTGHAAGRQAEQGAGKAAEEPTRDRSGICRGHQIRCRKIAALFCLLLLIVSQTGCSHNGGGGLQGEEAPLAAEDRYLLNTLCRIEIWEAPSEKQAQSLVENAFLLAQELERAMSRTIEGSDIDRINSAGGIPVEIGNAHVIEVLELGINYGELSGGLFDITIGRLAELWNFSSEAAAVPEAEKIQELLAHVDYRSLHWVPVVEGDPMAQEGGAQRWLVTLADPKAAIDLGGIAKGYIADQVADFLRENGVTSALLNFGGNVVCIGRKSEERPWVIAVERPFNDAEAEDYQRRTVGTIELQDQAAVTSGTYERQFVEEGVRYHHILDPNTGYPRQSGLSGVTVVGERSAQCDGLSTTCLMLGLEKGMELIENMPGFEAVFVEESGAISCTSGIALNEL